MFGVLAASSAAGGTMMRKYMFTGQEEAGDADLHNIQTAVIMMMVDNKLKTIPAPVTTPTSNMSAFPDATTQRPPGMSGYRLYGHDVDMDGVGETNYISGATSKWLYVVDQFGQVTQVDFIAPTPIPVPES